MAFLLKKNNATTTINMGGGFGAGVLTLVVTDGSVFPASGNFILTLWDKASYAQPGEDPGMEIIKCTVVAGNSLTVTRAQESTADVAHANGEAVELLITAGQFNDIESQVVVGPASATDHAIPRFDLATGKLLQDSSGLTLSDAMELSLASTATTGNTLGIVADSLTTGSAARFYSNSADTGTRTILKVINDNVLATGVTGVRIQQDGQGASNSGAYIYGDYTTGIGIQVSGDSLTTGKLAYFYSGSSDVSTRYLVHIVNDSSSAAGVACLRIDQDANGMAAQLIGGTTTDTSGVLRVVGNQLTTGYLATFSSNSADASARILVKILNDDPAAVGAVALYIQQDAAGYGISIDQNGNNRALYIDSEATTTDTVMIDGDVTTTGRCLVVSGSGLTTGYLAYLYSNSADVSSRQLVLIQNDNSAAVGTRCLNISQDANKEALYSECLGVTTGNAYAIYCHGLTFGKVLYINSSSADISSRNLVEIVNDNPLAAGATCLKIQQDSNAQGIDVRRTTSAGTNAFVYIDDSSNVGIGLGVYCSGLTSGKIAYFYSNSANVTARNLVEITNDNALATGAVCLSIKQDGNGSGAYGIYIEHTGDAQALRVVRSGGVGQSMVDFSDTSANVGDRNVLALSTVAGSGAKSLSIDQNSNAQSIYIDSEATTDHTIYIVDPTTTTGNVIFIPACNSLTTGHIAYFISNSADTSTRSLVEIVNDNTLATGATCLTIQQDAAANALYAVINAAAGAGINFTGGTGFNTGKVLYVTAGALTTGGLGYFYSNQADTSARNLLEIVNDNVASTLTTCLKIQQDGPYFGAFIYGVGTTTADVLRVTGDALTTGRLAYFYHNGTDLNSRYLVDIVNDNTVATSSVPLHIQQDAAATAFAIHQNGAYYAINVASANTTTAGFYIACNSLTTGNIANFYSNSADTGTRNCVEIYNANAAATGAIALSIIQVAAARAIYIDMNGNHNAIDVDAENTTQNTMNLISDVLTTGGILYLSSNSADTGARHLLDIINDNAASANTDCIRLRQDANNWALNILPANYGEIIYSTAVTTGYLLQVSDVSTLTTGKLAYFTSNSADVSARNLVSIVNDNSAAVGAVGLYIQQDAAATGIYIDHNANGPAIDIDWSGTTSNGIVVEGIGNNLTTGKLCWLYSDANTTDTRALLEITNDNTAATGTVCLKIQNDRTGGGKGIQIVDGNQGANKVLTSDANGIGTWVSSGGVPSGTILIWSGAISAIPAGFVICDGNNSTPNLTDRFVIHADADAAGTRNVGDTGGEQTHVLTTAELASHTHGMPDHYFVTGGNQYNRHLTSGTNTKTNSQGSTDAEGSDTAHQNMPKFYALAYIMKT